MRKLLISKRKTNIEKEWFAMPWQYDATCFNFNSPDELIPDDEIDAIGDPLEIENLVIKSDLKDYSFIKEMKNLRQLYLYNAYHLSNLSFLEELVNLKQICIVRSTVTSLDSINKLFGNKKSAFDRDEKDENYKFKGELNWKYWIDGLYIHSSKQGIKQSSLLKQGIGLGELILVEQK